MKRKIGLLLSVGLLMILYFRSAASQVDLEPRGTLQVCPTSSVPVRLRCSVHVNSSNQQLLWDATDSSGTYSFVLFCNTRIPSASGPYQPSAPGYCKDDRLNSTLTFNVTKEANVTCTRPGGPMQSVFVKFREIPPVPSLSLNTTCRNHTREVQYIAIIQWHMYTDAWSQIVFRISPSVSSCTPDCRKSTNSYTGQYSFPVDATIDYEITARAESCEGDLGSEWSTGLHVHLQVPNATMMCTAIPIYNTLENFELMELHVEWTAILSSASTGTVLNTTVSGYTVLYSTGTHSAEQSVLVSSCATGQCEIRLSLAGVNDTITRVTVQGENTFGRGEETQCNKHNISYHSRYMIADVAASDKAAILSLQWVSQPEVAPDLIQVFCSYNCTKDMKLCGQTKYVQGKNVTIPLAKINLHVRYCYLLKASGIQPFWMQGSFTIRSRPDTNNISKGQNTMTITVVIIIVLAAVGFLVLLVVVVVCCYCCNKRQRNPTENNDIPMQLLHCSTSRQFVNQPRGIAVSESGEIFVSDVSSVTIQDGKNELKVQPVHVFSNTGNWLKLIHYEFKAPRGIAIIDNCLFVSDCVNHVIKKISLPANDTPSLVSQSSQNDKLKLKYPYGLAAVSEIETLFICDNDNSRIVATDFNFNVKDMLPDVSLPGPTDVAYYNGKLYVADHRRKEGQIVVLEAKKGGSIINQFNSTHGEEFTFKTVFGIHVSANGYIFVADDGKNVVVVMDEKTKKLITKIGEGKLYQPHAVTVKDENVYVSSNASKDTPAAVYVFSFKNNNYDEIIGEFVCH